MTEYTYQWNPEWEDDPSMPQLKISKSSLNTFEFCRKQYEFSYIEGRKSEPNAAMARGSAVHNSYEVFYNNFELKKAEDLDSNNLYDYCMGLFPIDEHNEIYQTMAAFETERFNSAKISKSLDDYLPVGNEVMCNAKLEIKKGQHRLGRQEFTLQRDYTVHLQGIIDRVFREGDGFIPVELKTGAWKNPAQKRTSMRKEMAFYKVLMDADPDCNMDPVTHWAWYYPDSNYFEVEPVKSRHVNDVPKRIAKLIHAYEQEIFPAEYFYKKCQYCAFTGICNEAMEMWDW